MASDNFFVTYLLGVLMPKSSVTKRPYFVGRKFAALAFAALAVITSLGAATPASADTAFTYSIDSEGNATITGCDGSCDTQLVVPATIDDHPVTSIGEWAFWGKSLTSLTFLGDAVTASWNSWGQNPDLKFADVSSGTSGWGTTLGGLWVRVNHENFTYTTNAQNNVTVTGCVGPCPGVLTIPEQLGGNPVTTIGAWAFANYAGHQVYLDYVNLPGSVVTIEEAAFYENGVMYLTMGNSVTSIGDLAFEGNHLQPFTMSSALTTIGAGAFRNNWLSQITIPASVKSIGANAFRQEWMIQKVRFEGNAPTESADVFADNGPLSSVDVRYGTTGWGSRFSGMPVHVLYPPSAPIIWGAKSINGQVVIGTLLPRRIGRSAITGYEYTVNAGVTWTPVTSSDTLTRPRVSGLVGGTRYTLKLRAINGDGPGVESNAITFRPVTPATAPENVVVTSGAGYINLDFSAPLSDGGTPILRYGYSIDGGPWRSLGNVPGSKLIKLTNGKTYSVRLIAQNAAGLGTASPAIQVTQKR